MICDRCDRPLADQLTVVSLKRDLLDVLWIDTPPTGPPKNCSAKLCYPCLREFNKSEEVRDQLRRKMNYDNESWEDFGPGC